MEVVHLLGYESHLTKLGFNMPLTENIQMLVHHLAWEAFSIEVTNHSLLTLHRCEKFLFTVDI